MTNPYAQVRLGYKQVSTRYRKSHRSTLTTLACGLRKGLRELSADKAFSWVAIRRHLGLFFL